MNEVCNLAYEDYKSGMKYKDIAKKHGIKESTVKQWALRYWKNSDKSPPEKVTKVTKKVTDEKVTGETFSWADIETEYVTDISMKPCTLASLPKKYSMPICFRISKVGRSQ